MVRHPFERIVSAFQDKFIDNNSGVFRNLKKQMISRFGDATFISFVKMILASRKMLCTKVNKCTINRHWKPFIRFNFKIIFQSLIPYLQTMKGDLDFLELFIYTCNLSSNFDFSSCAYCNENYTFILKAETFKEDLKFLGMATNITFPHTGNHINIHSYLVMVE